MSDNPESTPDNSNSGNSIGANITVFVNDTRYTGPLTIGAVAMSALSGEQSFLKGGNLYNTDMNGQHYYQQTLEIREGLSYLFYAIGEEDHSIGCMAYGTASAQPAVIYMTLGFI